MGRYNNSNNTDAKKVAQMPAIGTLLNDSSWPSSVKTMILSAQVP
jgi:hypothetical protein